MTYGTIDGTPIREDDITAMISQAEAGFPHARFRKAGRPRMGTSPTEAVRLDPDQLQELDRHAQQAGLVDFLRLE